MAAPTPTPRAATSRSKLLGNGKPIEGTNADWRNEPLIGNGLVQAGTCSTRHDSNCRGCRSCTVCQPERLIEFEHTLHWQSQWHADIERWSSKLIHESDALQVLVCHWLRQCCCRSNPCGLLAVALGDGKWSNARWYLLDPRRQHRPRLPFVHGLTAGTLD